MTKKEQIEERAQLLARRDVHACLSGVVGEMLRKDEDCELLEIIEAARSDALIVCREADRACKGRDPLDAYDDDQWEAHPELSREAFDGNEIYEYWAVCPMLARELASRGEIVVDDFFGLVLWCRQASGQAISADHVFRAIAREHLK